MMKLYDEVPMVDHTDLIKRLVNYAPDGDDDGVINDAAKRIEDLLEDNWAKAETIRLLEKNVRELNWVLVEAERDWEKQRKVMIDAIYRWRKDVPKLPMVKDFDNGWIRAELNCADELDAALVTLDEERKG